MFLQNGKRKSMGYGKEKRIGRGIKKRKDSSPLTGKVLPQYLIRTDTRLSFHSRNYRYVSLVFTTYLERYSTIYQCEQSVV
jgi:hypothetical protein